MFLRFLRGFEIALLLFVVAALTGYSNPSPNDPIETIRAYTRNLEFDYLEWMGDAALLKLRAAAVNLPASLARDEQKRIVVEYLQTLQTIFENEYRLSQIYADPAIEDKDAASESVHAALADSYARQNQIAPLAESILQEQVAQVLVEQGLTFGGQPIPSVWYRSTPLPLALIVSPRERIEQTANISINADLALDEQVKLEDRVSKNLNVSSLVVEIGGVGVYPTMVARTTNLNWLLSTIAHEWIHNYLTQRPLGLLYDATPELRTINETTASIAGDEIGNLVIAEFYPELKSAARPTLSMISFSSSISPAEAPDPPPFDFRAEMRETRIGADALLAEGKIDEAETYMEARRQIFLQNGYLIRKLNQAYFAFHGAYADTPGGAAGEDPVGAAMRALRAQSASLKYFVQTVAWMRSFDQLKKAVNQP